VGAYRNERLEIAFRAEFVALSRYLARRVGREMAMDIAAETFAIALARWSRFDRSRPVRPWLYGIASNLVRRRGRVEERQLRAYARTGVDPVFSMDEDAVAERLDAHTQQRQLARALADLRPKEREILLLHAWAELSDDEIAAALAIPVGTVKSRLHRLRACLRNSLAANGEELMQPHVRQEEALSRVGARSDDLG
jgi:RNA polymerase sigma factor (sigma-70 family)